MQFSQDLVDECKEVFKEENGVEFSDEQAQDALENLSGLFLAFAKDRPKAVDQATDSEPNNP